MRFGTPMSPTPELAQRGVELAKDGIDQLLGDLPGRRGQPPKLSEHQNDVQGQAREPALDGVGDAEPRIKRGVAGGLGDAPMQRGDESGARVSSEEAEDRHSAAEEGGGALPCQSRNPALRHHPHRAQAPAPALSGSRNDASPSQHPRAPWRRRPPRARRAACTMGEEFHRGYLVDERAVNQVQSGMNAEQVLKTLGTPSTVSTVGNKSWYYISQRARRRVAFLGRQRRRPAGDRGLFRPEPQGRARRALRAAGRQDLRLRVADDAGRRRRPQLRGQLFRGLGSWIPN